MSSAVHNMFQSIATRYDAANDVLSLGVHRLWRHKAAKFGCISKGEHVVDLCTGTGDFAFVLANRIGVQGKVVAIDFVNEMLEIAKTKQAKFTAQNPNSAPILFFQADAMNTKLESQTFNAATIGFGIRNVSNPLECLKEIRRILAPQGRVIILEFGQPWLPIFKSVYSFYSSKLMPILGWLVTGNREAYEYLPETSKSFPSGEKFIHLMQEADFTRLKYRSLFGGIAYIYLGYKSDAE